MKENRIKRFNENSELNISDVKYFFPDKDNKTETIYVWCSYKRYLS
jgi:hypothetical protein